MRFSEINHKWIKELFLLNASFSAVTIGAFNKTFGIDSAVFTAGMVNRIFGDGAANDFFIGYFNWNVTSTLSGLLRVYHTPLFFDNTGGPAFTEEFFSFPSTVNMFRSPLIIGNKVRIQNSSLVGGGIFISFQGFKVAVTG
jgi:hypothetical protein